MYSVAHIAETDSSYTVSPMMRHDSKFNKRRKGLGSLARSPFSFWNSLIVQYFCLPHPYTSKSSHIALIIAASQHAPAKHQTFLVCTFVLSLSPSLPEWRTEHAAQGFRDVLGLFSKKTKLKKCTYTGACVRMVFAAVHCCAASIPTHQPAADTHVHCFLTHTVSMALGSSSVPAIWGCWPNDLNLLFWAMSCLA